MTRGRRRLQAWRQGQPTSKSTSSSAPSPIPWRRAEALAQQRQRTGLSPFLLERNKHVQTARSLKGSALTQAELKKVHGEFQEFWEGLPDHDIYIEAYQMWRESKPTTANHTLAPFKATWGGGCSAAPISSLEFLQHHRELGWPSDAEVFDPNSGKAPSPSTTSPSNWVDLSGTNLWSIGARPHNVSNHQKPCEHQFRFVERGLTTVLQNVGKAVVDKGEVLLLVSCPRLHQPGGYLRIAFFVSGFCYSPLVFEVARCRFEDPSHAIAPELPLPSLCEIRSRPCRITSAFDCIDLQTSDALILDLVLSMATMRLSIAQYTVVDRAGTLLWSRVIGLEDVGCLWEPGQAQHLGAAEASRRNRQSAAQNLLQKLAQGDPLSSAPKKAARTRARAAPRPAGTSASGRALKRARTQGAGHEQARDALADGNASDGAQASVCAPGTLSGAANAEEGRDEAMLQTDAMDDELDLTDALKKTSSATTAPSRSSTSLRRWRTTTTLPWTGLPQAPSASMRPQKAKSQPPSPRCQRMPAWSTQERQALQAAAPAKKHLQSNRYGKDKPTTLGTRSHRLRHQAMCSKGVGRCSASRGTSRKGDAQ